MRLLPPRSTTRNWPTRMSEIPHPRVLAGDAKIERARLMRRAHRYRDYARSAKRLDLRLFWLDMCRQYVALARRQNRIVASWMAASRKVGIP